MHLGPLGQLAVRPLPTPLPPQLLDRLTHCLTDPLPPKYGESTSFLWPALRLSLAEDVTPLLQTSLLAPTFRSRTRSTCVAACGCSSATTLSLTPFPFNVQMWAGEEYAYFNLNTRLLARTSLMLPELCFAGRHLILPRPRLTTFPRLYGREHFPSAVASRPVTTRTPRRPSSTTSATMRNQATTLASLPETSRASRVSTAEQLES